MSGWKLAAALFGKKVSNVGDSLAETLANADPESAAEFDREKLTSRLREAAAKLAEARRSFTAEQADVDRLVAQIAADEKAAGVLIAKYEAKEIDEATLTEFADNLESMKARLPAEEAEAAQAQELVTTLEDILGGIEKQLADFDNRAQAAVAAIRQASAEKERQALRLEQQQELQNLRSGLGAASTALGALGKKAAKMQDEAAASKTLADIGQKPVDRANAVEEARRIAAGGAAEPVSAADRLRKLSGN